MTAKSAAPVSAVFPVVCTGDTALSATVMFSKGELIECETAEHQKALLRRQVQTSSDAKGKAVFTKHFALPAGMVAGVAVARRESDPSEAERVAVYNDLLAGGLSDAEARATAWPAETPEQTPPPPAEVPPEVALVETEPVEAATASEPETPAPEGEQTGAVSVAELAQPRKRGGGKAAAEGTAKDDGTAKDAAPATGGA